MESVNRGGVRFGVDLDDSGSLENPALSRSNMIPTIARISLLAATVFAAVIAISFGGVPAAVVSIVLVVAVAGDLLRRSSSTLSAHQYRFDLDMLRETGRRAPNNITSVSNNYRGGASPLPDFGGSGPFVDGRISIGDHSNNGRHLHQRPQEDERVNVGDHSADHSIQPPLFQEDDEEDERVNVGDHSDNERGDVRRGDEDRVPIKKKK